VPLEQKPLDPNPADSLFPKLVAIARDRQMRRLALVAVRWLVPLIVGGGIIPAWTVTRAWLKRVNADHTNLEVVREHIEKLENAVAISDRAALAELTLERLAQSASVRAQLEYVAGARRMDVSSVLADYDHLIANWSGNSPECLDAKRCATPTEAARKALAVRKPR
jgi:hypothetical protein